MLGEPAEPVAKSGEVLFDGSSAEPVGLEGFQVGGDSGMRPMHIRSGEPICSMAFEFVRDLTPVRRGGYFGLEVDRC